jgi:hypothetical protein
MHEIVLSILIGDGETYVSSIEDAKNDGEWIINYGEIEKKGCNIIYRKFCLEPQGFEMKELIMAD